MNRKSFSIVFSIFLGSALNQSIADVDESIRVSLEEPVNGKYYSSIANLRGWAVGPNGIERISIFVDGEHVFDVPYGGRRADVGSVFPELPNSENTGFSMAYNYKSLAPGIHTMVARAYDRDGNYNESTSVFEAARFQSDFFADESLIDISEVSSIYLKDSNSVVLSGVNVEGASWEVTFGWDTASQDFNIEGIAASADPDSDDYSLLCYRQYEPENFAGAWRITLSSSGSDFAGKACPSGDGYIVIEEYQWDDNYYHISSGYYALLEGRAEQYEASGSIDEGVFVSNGIFVTGVSSAGATLGDWVLKLNGTFSGAMGSGPWSDIHGCSGTWSANRQ